MGVKGIIKSFITTFLMVILPAAHAVINSNDRQLPICKQIKKYSSVDVDCTENYQHYHPKESTRATKNKIDIAAFNLLQPVITDNSRFKDHGFIASLINKWDLVAAVELMGFTTYTKVLNQNVIDQLEQLDENSTEYQKIKAIYRIPGYLDILQKLQQLDPSWGLLITGYSQGSEAASTRELIGYFYRSKYVNPIENDYCKLAAKPGGNKKAYACLPKFKKKIEEVFSRKPFIASFKANKFDFTLLANHVVFSSSNNDLRNQMAKYIFKKVGEGEDGWKEVGIGNMDEFVRVGEIHQTIKFMNYLKESHKEKDVILLGDFNLEYNNEHLLNFTKGWDLFQKDLTSIASDSGLSSNYDHFIFNQNITTECDGEQSKHYDFTRYFRPMQKYNYENRTTRSREFEQELDNRKKINARGEMIPEFTEYAKSKLIKKFKNAVFDSQIAEEPYRVYREVLSDHLPIVLNCDISQKDDD